MAIFTKEFILHEKYISKYAKYLDNYDDKMKDKEDDDYEEDEDDCINELYQMQNNLRNFLLKDKPHIKKYKKSVNLYFC